MHTELQTAQAKVRDLQQRLFGRKTERGRIERGKFGISIWVDVLLDKFLYGHPSHRLMAELADHGLKLSAGTLTGGRPGIAARLWVFHSPAVIHFVPRRWGGEAAARGAHRPGCDTTMVHAEAGGRGSGPRCVAAEEDRAAPCTVPMKEVPQQCDALGRVRPAPSAGPRCTWTVRLACSCVRAAVHRSCFAAIATMASATARVRVRAWPAAAHDARARSATSAAAAGAWPTRRARSAGARASAASSLGQAARLQTK